MGSGRGAIGNILLTMAATDRTASEETHRTIAPLVGPDDDRVFTEQQ